MAGLRGNGIWLKRLTVRKFFRDRIIIRIAFKNKSYTRSEMILCWFCNSCKSAQYITTYRPRRFAIGALNAEQYCRSFRI